MLRSLSSLTSRSAPGLGFSGKSDLISAATLCSVSLALSAHAPNEIYLVEPAEGVPVAGLAEIEKAYVDLLYALATQ